MLSMTLCYYGECTIYRYIQNPLLLKGRKFDVRSYLLIACTTPYMVFFRHGYVRLTCDLYDPNTNNMSAHLTNQVNTVAIFISHNLNNILYKRSLLYWDHVLNSRTVMPVSGERVIYYSLWQTNQNKPLS